MPSVDLVGSVRQRGLGLLVVGRLQNVAGGVEPIAMATTTLGRHVLELPTQWGMPRLKAHADDGKQAEESLEV